MKTEANNGSERWIVKKQVFAGADRMLGCYEARCFSEAIYNKS